MHCDQILLMTVSSRYIQCQLTKTNVVLLPTLASDKKNQNYWCTSNYYQPAWTYKRNYQKLSGYNTQWFIYNQKYLTKYIQATNRVVSTWKIRLAEVGSKVILSSGEIAFNVV